MKDCLTVLTRRSNLARRQSAMVCEALQSKYPDLNIQVTCIESTGDRHPHKPLAEFGGKTVFVKDIETQLLTHDNAIAVHSLKDMSVHPHAELCIAAVLPRADSHDVLICRDQAYTSLACLPKGASIGTSSPRRAAQLLAARDDLRILPIRGNIDTRIQHCLNGRYDAIVLAAAGIHRLNLNEHISATLSKNIMLPAIAQGIIAIQCRRQNTSLRAQLHAINDESTEHMAIAERAVNQVLGGDCHTPIAAQAEITNTCLTIKACVASHDGKTILRAEASGAQTEAQTLGEQVGKALLSQGGAKLCRK